MTQPHPIAQFKRWLKRSSRKLRTKPGRIAQIVLSLGAALLIFLLGHLPVFGEQQATITVDFAAPQAGVSSMSGFLYGIGNTKPPDSVIKPLQPALWRTSRLQHYSRVQKLGGVFQLLVSDTYGYGTKNPWPYEDYAKWEAHVRQLAQQQKGKNILWDIWNEPDIKDPFWKGSRDQLFETYKRAYQVLRQELGPDVMIGGPSIAKYDRGYLKAFLDYCKKNNLEVNVLTWHELNDQKITAISSHIQEARREFQQNPDYSSLKIQKLYVNEIVGPTAQYRPAENLGYLYYTEQGKADGACKACWEPVGGGKNNCFNESLDGLVVPETSEPRAVWWLYQTYADGFKTRVQSAISTSRVVALASQSNSAQQPQVIFGYFEQGVAAPQAKVTLILKNLQRLPGFQPDKPLTLTVKQIPDSGEKVVKSLPTVKQEQVTVTNQAIRLTIPNVTLHEAYVLTVG
ncbi:MAG: beta-xylosidase [Oscillatoriales cyanobacterium RM1_1_9]|nr:beta-xylosidase [Oscillatoriales cyanobacterium SM2_3_0]NJO47777.1 beta-xylosidase [Oscillatoriales cyanobacterium RM2_1_1]NJO72114.1 beta-xylosidase [Oscillatoriales cyanobacterium RM1_1_9]